MPLHVLNPAVGFSPGIGFFVSGMEEAASNYNWLLKA